MAELELKGIEYFRKGTTIRKVNEDPTLLSFMLVFNTGSVSDSPLLTNKPGGALDYLENVVNVGSDNEGKGPGATYAESLKNFQKLLMKINKEMPWFWQSISGLETTMQFGGMQDPFWGKDKKIEIECLEENVELMGLTLMRLYRDACFDYQRWVEVIPENLRKFSIDIYVSEIRTFQQDIAARNKDLFGNLPKGTVGTDPVSINTEMAASAKPFYHVQLGHCTWDMDSTNDILAGLGKNPEVKKPKLTFFYKTVKTPTYRWGSNLGVAQEVLIEPKKDPTVDAYNPANPILGAAKSKFAKLKDKAIGGTVAQFKNLAQGVTGGPGLGNANGKILGGAAASIVNNAIDNVVGSVLLDNVYGVSTLSTIAGAIQQGSINGILNAAGQLAGNLTGSGNSGGVGGDLSSIYDGPGIDSSPDGNISPKKVYDDSPGDNDDISNDNVYGGVDTGVDSTPDGNLNDNVHE